MAGELLLTIFLVLFNGFFVAAEFAIVKVRLSQIELKAKSSQRVADLSKNILKNLDAYLSATQLGITLASLGLGWVGEALFADIIISLLDSLNFQLDIEYVHGLSLTIAFICITVMHIVFGELAPKSLAIQKPLNTTFAIAYPLHFFYILLRPFIWVLNGLASSIVRGLGINPVLGHETHTSEELQIILNQSKESGTLDQDEHELIQNVFEFNDRVIKKIMVPRTKICAIEVTQSLEEIMEIITNERFTRIPVYRESIDDIIGFLHVKDVFSSMFKKEVFKMHQLLRPVLFVPETMRLNELLKQMQGKSAPMVAIVLDEFGGTAGLATIEDVVEELVGEIQDEYDEERPIVENKGNGEFIIQANAAVADINEFIPIEIPEDDNYDSLAGYITLLFEHIPEVGESITKGDYTFTVLQRQDLTLSSIKLEYHPTKK